MSWHQTWDKMQTSLPEHGCRGGQHDTFRPGWGTGRGSFQEIAAPKEGVKEGHAAGGTGWAVVQSQGRKDPAVECDLVQGGLRP